MVIDTNILIAYLDGQKQVVRAIQTWKSRSPLFISSISRVEVLALAKLTPANVDEIKTFLENFISVPLDDFLAETAALFRRNYNLALADAVIIATAANKQLPLVSRDKQFKKIKEITVIEI